MVTISVCMIVKNEQRKLRQCLDSLKCIADEFIIVDTGSTDNTKAIAAEYTDKVYDFEWVNDFSKARNFAFEKATCDYIYSADADEEIDEYNREEFVKLKSCLMPEVEIVQMIYCNPGEINMAYNNLRELRPKLFKRLRTFTWIDPIHETVRTDPVVFDSDIEIMHKPEANHASRDFRAFLETLRKNNGKMSDRLFSMYAKELFFNGDKDEFRVAFPYFEERIGHADSFEELEALCVCARANLEAGDLDESIMELDEVFSGLVERPSELAYIIGQAFARNNKPEEAEKYMKLAEVLPAFIRDTYRPKHIKPE